VDDEESISLEATGSQPLSLQQEEIAMQQSWLTTLISPKLSVLQVVLVLVV
jgi:hypothetical protein